MKGTIIYIMAIILVFMDCCKLSIPKTGNTYYVDNISGNDKNRGTERKPLRSINELNLRMQKNAGSICFKGGQVFQGTLFLKGIQKTDSDTLRISSYGGDRAIINGAGSEAIRIDSCRYLLISNLDLKGNGRKNGNKTNGISISNSSGCKIENIDASGFQKSGIDLYNCTESQVERVNASENGFCGINIMGSARNLSRKILIHNCKAENNPGDPTNLENHSGNGILVGISDSVMIDHCSATNNGWDMPRKGNGPVGIWTWGSDHVIIQYCISYRNKTSEHAQDGGGFDLDGGVTNSIIQYCLSYENQGAGYGLFQFSGASDWSDNTVRYCVSINDGQITGGSGGIFIWNGSGDSLQLVNCRIYNNVIYNSKAPLISYETSSSHKNFIFCNNIFLSLGNAISGIYDGSTFIGNDWWNTSGRLKFLNFRSLSDWAGKTGQEMFKGHLAGIQSDPKFTGPLTTEITDPYQLDKLYGYKLLSDSPLKNKGLDLKTLFGFELPATDFYGNPLSPGTAVEPGIFSMN